MKKSLLFRFALCMFAFSLIMTSCSKEANTEIIEETVEPIDIQPSLLVTINGVTESYDAYAAYCNDGNGKEFLTVSNNQLLLGTDLIIEDFQVDDFLVYYAKDGENEMGIGGATFEDNSNGTPITSVIIGPGEVTITEANSTFATGSMSGEFQLMNGTTATYSVEFTAEVVQASPFCD